MKNIAVISTDWHLQSKNLEQIIKLNEQEIIEANNHGTKLHIWLGDIFDSRVSQRQDILNGLTRIIEMYDEAGHQIICIPGNHDKTNYNSRDSFLDAYKYHPSFDLIDDIDVRNIEGINCYFAPFFEDKLLYENLEAVEGKEGLLFGHFAVSGSVNNDGTKVENRIKPSMFKSFQKVFLGHYHNYQEIGGNILHLGSLSQNDFSDDEFKGFWLLSLEKGEIFFDLIPSKGVSFKKLEINLEEVSQKQVKELIYQFKKENEGANLRVIVKGNGDSVQSFDSHEYQELGIDIKKKVNEIEGVDADERISAVNALSAEDITDRFKNFCEENSYDYEEGMVILKEILYGDKRG